MKLHRADSTPQWEKIGPGDRTLLQRVAAATHGILTIANLATFIGIILVIIGLLEILNQNYWWGAILVIIGRSCDLLDGWLAELTATKSPLGELLDAVVDKIGTFLAIAALFVAGIAPVWLLVLLLLPHVIIAVISAIARWNKTALHPSRIGKISMAVLWVALFGFIIVRALELSSMSMLSIMVTVIAFLSFVLGVWAAAGYVKDRD